MKKDMMLFKTILIKWRAEFQESPLSRFKVADLSWSQENYPVTVTLKEIIEANNGREHWQICSSEED